MDRGPQVSHALLELPSITEDKVAKIVRPPTPSSHGVIDEVQILFTTTDVRDTVIGSSSKLAGKVDSTGRPTAGIRIEIPPHLKAAFNVLNHFGQQLRTRHGIGTCRHVKFDDMDRSLYLNIRLPGEDGWSRVDLEFARRGMKIRRRIDSQEMEERFDLEGASSNGWRRPASTSSMQVDAPAAQDARRWTGPRTGSVS